MSQISQQKAGEISVEMSKHLETAFEEAKKAFRQRVYEIYIDSIKGKVLSLFCEERSYMHGTKQLSLSGNGFNYEKVTLFKSVPSITDYTQAFEPDPAEAKELMKLLNKMEDAQSAHIQLKLDIKTALLSLRSFTRIREQFPEAAKYLPVGNVTTTALTVDLSSLRKKL